MGMLERLLAWLRAPTSARLQKGHPDLSPIDIDKLAKELRLVEDAARLGAAGQPPADARTSGPERAVIQRVEKARQDYVDWADMRINVLNQDLGRRDVTQEVNRALQADQEFDRKASAIISDKEIVLRTLRDVAARRKDELSRFKARHRLVREASYPRGSRVFFNYALLLALIVAEGMFNAKFFASGLGSGLLGGLIEAGMLAAFNVGVAFLFGKFGVRLVYHVNPFLKLIGAAGVAAAAAVMTGVGLGIAHYRDALVAELPQAASAAQQNFIATPFHLGDGFSWLLFGISIVFALLALFDGLYSDDRYPGYGDVSRKEAQAREDYEEELEVMRSALEALKQEQLQALEDTLQRSQGAVAGMESLINDKRSAGSRLGTALRVADHALEALLHKFRSENQLHRNGVPRPSYFDQPTVLQPVVTPRFDTAEEEAQLARQRALVAMLLDQAEAVRARIQAAFNHQFDRLKPLATHFDGGGTS